MHWIQSLYPKEEQGEEQVIAQSNREKNRGKNRREKYRREKYRREKNSGGRGTALR